MGVEPPYLYDRPSRRNLAEPYYDFNPRAYTQASLSPKPQPRPRKEGPLIDFNKHPDSYMIVPYRPTYVSPMPASTKTQVVVVRWIQFAFRMMQLIGAVGLLVLVICIRGTSDTQGWMIKIPPAWDGLLNLYALYHLMRPAKRRPAGSSASYHFFALCMDVGLIPFYTFIAFFAQSNWAVDAGTSGRWRSFFSDTTATNDILLATWLTAIAVGGLHLFSVAFDIHLIIMFRRISRLPPDMNPLDTPSERKASKHKHKNSEATLSMTEKRLAHLSGSTLNISTPTRLTGSGDRLIPEANVRPISFMHTRQDSNMTYASNMSRENLLNIYTNSSARNSRADLLPRSADHSRNASRSRSRPASQHSHARNTLSVDHDPMPDLSRTHSPFSFATESPSRRSTPLQAAVPNAVAQAQQKEGLLSDNWYVLDEGSDLGSPQRGRTPLPRYESEEIVSGFRTASGTYLATNQSAEMLGLGPSRSRKNGMLPQPLRMHPPSPPKQYQPQLQPLQDHHHPQQQQERNRRASYEAYDDMDLMGGGVAIEEEEIGRAITTVSEKSSMYSRSQSSPRRPSFEPDSEPTSSPRTDLDFGSPELAQGQKKGYGVLGGWSQLPQREVSRNFSAASGADIADASVLYVDEGGAFGGGARRRDVSGKVAEEGRGGGWFGMRQRQVSANA